jgi:Holliday junction resolvase-like predicted endonuclease
MWPPSQRSLFLPASLSDGCRTPKSSEAAPPMLARLTQFTVRSLDRLAARVLTVDDRPEHQRTGRRGEEEAYFWLRKQGYVVVAPNYRSPRRRGEIDLTGWDGDVLCFIEVKTRTSHGVKPAEAAVDHEKRKELRGVARVSSPPAIGSGPPVRCSQHLPRKVARHRPD